MLRERYADMQTAELAAMVGHTLSSTYQRARKLGLQKAAEFVAQTARARTMRADHGGRQHQFKPGVSSWSKGTKGLVGVQEGCRATQFKKGRPAAEARNYLPIGSLRVCADGYIERKVTDDPSLMPARRWIAVHRLVWEAVHGSIPAGCVVVFRPGRKTTDVDLITVDALECLTRQQLMLRNTYHRYGPDVAKVVQLRGAITRQINKRAKAGNEQNHQ